MAQPTIGVLTLEIVVEHARSLKDKRSVVKSLKDRLRERFNVSVAEIDGMESWQRAVVAVATVAGDHGYAQALLQRAEDDAAGVLGGMLVSTSVEWIGPQYVSDESGVLFHNAGEE